MRSFRVVGRIALFSGIFFWITSPDASATILSPPTGPATSASGNYQINYVVPATCNYIALEERVSASAAWVTVDSDQNGVFLATGRSSGSYEYRVSGYCFLPGPMVEDDYFVGGSISVVVSITSSSPLQSYDEQVKTDYVIRSGNLNSDGQLDFAVIRVGGTTLDGMVNDTLLLSEPDGSYAAYVPTNSQQQQVSGWAEANVNYGLRDINRDGVVDVILRGLSRSVSNAPDLVIYSPGAVNSDIPRGVLEITNSVRDFVADANQLFQDFDWVQNQEVFVDSGYWDYRLICTLSWNSEDLFEEYYECFYHPFWVATSTVVYPGVHSRVVDLDTALEDLIATNDVSGMRDIIESIFGVAVGNLQRCLGTHIDLDWVPSSEHATQCALIDLLGVVDLAEEALREMDADEAEEAEELKESFGRKPGRIYISSRYIDTFLGERFFIRHRSISYYDVLGPVPTHSWYSAFASGNGRPMFSELNEESDNPANTRIDHVMGGTTEVLPPMTAIWLHLTGLRDNYPNDCVPYHNIAIDPGYNSNGWVSGLVAAGGYLGSFPDSITQTYAGLSQVNPPGSGDLVPNRFFNGTFQRATDCTANP